jgi:hypothetical protein
MPAIASAPHYDVVAVLAAAVVLVIVREMRAINWIRRILLGRYFKVSLLGLIDSQEEKMSRS